MGFFESLMGWRNELTQRRKDAKNSLWYCHAIRGIKFDLVAAQCRAGSFAYFVVPLFSNWPEGVY